MQSLHAQWRAFWQWLKDFDTDTQLVIEVFVIVFAVLLVNLALRLVLNRLHRRLKATQNPWDDAFVDALRKPLAMLMWIVGITYAAEIVAQQTETSVLQAAGPIRDVAVVAMIAWFLIRLIRRVEANVLAYREARGEKVDHTTVDAIAKLLRLSVLITASLVVLQTLGFSISGVLAFGGIGGIAIGFAAKDLLANFFGGLMIYLDRPFSVGDWVRSPDREIEGHVEQIGWRLTQIRTFDKRPLYIPNSAFANIAVENPSRMSHRRIRETVGIRYDDAAQMRVIITDVKQMLLEHPEIDSTQTMIVNFDSFGPSSLDFFIYTFTRTTNWIHYHEVKQDVLLKVLDIIEGHGAEVAFPTTTVHVPDGLQLQEEAAFAQGDGTPATSGGRGPAAAGAE